MTSLTAEPGADGHHLVGGAADHVQRRPGDLDLGLILLLFDGQYPARQQLSKRHDCQMTEFMLTELQHTWTKSIAGLSLRRVHISALHDA